MVINRRRWRRRRCDVAALLHYFPLLFLLLSIVAQQMGVFVVGQAQTPAVVAADGGGAEVIDFTLACRKGFRVTAIRRVNAATAAAPRQQQQQRSRTPGSLAIDCQMLVVGGGGQGGSRQIPLDQVSRL